MKTYTKIIAALLFVLSFTFTLIFRNLPAGKLWDDYSVLYVNTEIPDNVISSALNESGIFDYISLNNQFLPINLNQFAPEISFLKANYDNPKFDYLSRRNSFFFDKSNSYRLYYIPSESKNKLNLVNQKLSSQKITIGIDTTSNYPFVIPILLVLSVVLFAFYSKNKFLFVFSSILPVLFVLCNPFYTISVAIILLLLCLFFLSNIWNRKGALLFLVTNYAVPVMLCISLIAAFSCSYKIGLLYTLCFLGTGSSIIIYHEVENFLKSRKSFNPVYILSARRTSIFAKKQSIILGGSLGLSTVLVIFFFLTAFTGISTANRNSSKIMIPAKNGNNSEVLPDLDEYYQWYWNVKTAPYASLNEYNDTLQVDYPRYVSENGKIHETFQHYEFSDDFKLQIFNEIDNLKFNSIEKVLKSQDSNKIGYTSINSYKTSIFAIILLLLSYFMLLFLYIFSIIKKGFKK